MAEKKETSKVKSAASLAAGAISAVEVGTALASKNTKGKIIAPRLATLGVTGNMPTKDKVADAKADVKSVKEAKKTIRRQHSPVKTVKAMKRGYSAPNKFFTGGSSSGGAAGAGIGGRGGRGKMKLASGGMVGRRGKDRK
jgi:hypothetical protein